MNSIHNNGENDKSLNDDLDKLSGDYGQLEHDEPPELLDQAILNSAHRAVEKKPHWMKFGWLHGLTTAAVFVLAFSIILNQREPVPVFENGMRSNESVRLQREKAAKKQSTGELKSEDRRMDMKVISENRQELLRSMPAASAPEGLEREDAAEDMAQQPVLEVQSSLDVRAGLLGKTDRVDKDAPARELMLEEELMDEVDAMVVSPQTATVAKEAFSATVAEPAAVAEKARARTDSEAEQRLLEIIKLKQNGNERWETELELFREAYPDYPIPDELTNQAN
jgi:hypothetical protein